MFFRKLVDRDRRVADRGEGDVHFVKRAIGVPTDAFEPVVASVFHHVPLPEKPTVGLDADGHDEVIRGAGVLKRFVSQRVAELSFVGVGRQ